VSGRPAHTSFAKPAILFIYVPFVARPFSDTLTNASTILNLPLQQGVPAFWLPQRPGSHHHPHQLPFRVGAFPVPLIFAASACSLAPRAQPALRQPPPLRPRQHRGYLQQRLLWIRPRYVPVLDVLRAEPPAQAPACCRRDILPDLQLS